MQQTERSTLNLNEDVTSGVGGSDTRELDVFAVLITLAQRKRLIASATLTTALITALVVLFMPNRYVATARILPPAQSQSTASMLMSQLSGSGAGLVASMAGKDFGLKDPNDVYIGLLKSRTVQDALIKQFDLGTVYDRKRPSSIRSALSDATDIRSGKDSLISIAVEDKDPKRAADMANAYVSELRNLTMNLAVTEASQRSHFFEQQLSNAKAALSDAEIELKETQKSTGIIDFDSQAKTVIGVIGDLRARIAAKEVEIEGMESFAADKNPNLILVRRELASLRAQLARAERQEKGGEGNPLIATARVPEAGLRYVRRVREVKYREALLGFIAQQYEAAKLDEAKQGTVVQVVDPAIAPDRKSSPRRTLSVLLMSLVAFFFSCVYVLARESWGCVMQDSDRARQWKNLVDSLSH